MDDLIHESFPTATWGHDGSDALGAAKTSDAAIGLAQARRTREYKSELDRTTATNYSIRTK